MQLRFGEFTLDVDQRRLLGSTGEIPLSPKAFELLKLLIDERPRALSKDEILARLWSDTFVTENSLATVIRDLRAALGDSAKDPSFIRTAYAYGYAFVGEVTELPPPLPAVSPWCLIIEHREVHLQEGVNILGRSGPGVIVIDSATISRRHARLTIRGPYATCEDLRSKNGTWVNQMRADRPLDVKDGDELRLGSVVVVARYAPQARSTLTAVTAGK